MENKEIKRILCAVRSRPGGEETVQRAIELALVHNARLTFVQVVDFGFVDRFSPRSSSRKAAYDDMVDMAAFTLSLLCDRAQDAGVKEVDYIVREGGVRQQLLTLVSEEEIDLLVMGRAKPMPGQRAFENDDVPPFVSELEQLGVIVDRG